MRFGLVIFIFARFKFIHIRQVGEQIAVSSDRR